MMLVLPLLCGFLLDLLLADPACIPHPVVIMGKAISALEKRLRRVFPKTPEGERAAGRILAAVLPLGTLLCAGVLCCCAAWVSVALLLVVETIWAWQVLAVQGLAREARNVLKCLRNGDLEASRAAVARVVGRDTAALDEAGVTRAAVETVAENFSDGVVAPMLCFALGGAPLALAYKAINTMDSMVGYKNKKYLWFGRAAAKLDDAANYIPSRLAALLLVLAAPLCGLSLRGGWCIWRRDRRNHASPNSAQTESVMAGALGVQLAGPACYFGELYEKPTIGDPLRPIEPEDIARANRMLYVGSALCLLLCLGIAAVMWRVWLIVAVLLIVRVL